MGNGQQSTVYRSDIWLPDFHWVSGEMSLRAEDSRKLLLKLVGTENFLGQQKLTMLFRAFLMTRVKTYIAQVMKTKAINIFEIDENLTLFSESLKALLVPGFCGLWSGIGTVFCHQCGKARWRPAV